MNKFELALWAVSAALGLALLVEHVFYMKKQ